MKKINLIRWDRQLEDGWLIRDVQAYIKELKKKIYQDLETDKAIKADPYDNVARLRICEKIEKFIAKRGGDGKGYRVSRVMGNKVNNKQRRYKQMNSVTLLGRLTKDVEPKESSIMLSMATNEGYDKEKKEPRVWFVNVFAFSVNEALIPYLQKGREVLVRNAVVSNVKTKDGSYSTFVRVYGGNGNIQLLGSKPKGEELKVEKPESSASDEKTDEIPY
jgi:single-stranded DNA-binding protein